MRHLMFRGLASLLAGSLAIAPIPAFALRAGLEGKTEEKVAQALEGFTPAEARQHIVALAEAGTIHGIGVGRVGRSLSGAKDPYLENGLPGFLAAIARSSSSGRVLVTVQDRIAMIEPAGGHGISPVSATAAAAAPAQHFGTQLGQPLTSEALHSLLPGTHIRLGSQGGEISYYRVSRAWTQHWPTIGLQAVDAEGRDNGRNMAWSLTQIAERTPVLVSLTGLEEGRFGLTMSVDRSVTSALNAATARLDKLPKQIRSAHEQILAWDGQWMSKAAVEAAAAQNVFVRIGAEWQEEPANHPDQVRVISRLGPYTMPDYLLQHPDQLQQVQTEADAFRGRIAAEGSELKRVDHLGMGGSAAIGQALQQSGLLGKVVCTVVQTSDRSVWRALLPDLAETIVEYLKTTGVEPMSMGMTSEEPVILLAYYVELCRVLSVPLDPRLEMLTLKHSSVYQFAEAQQMAHRLIALQPDGRETAAGRMSGPTATKFPLRFLALNGIDLTEWVRAAQLSQKEQETFLSLGTALAVLAEQGKNKVTLMLPKALAFLAPWLKQLFEESLGRVGKGPLSQFDPQVPFKVVIDEPLDPAFHRPAAESDRVFLTLQTDDARLSTAQAGFLTLMQNAGHPRLDVEVQGAWEKRLAGIFQGGLVALAAVADRWGLRFINQPSVEEYKRIAKLMVIEVMKAGGYLKAEDFDANGTVIPKRYFEELPRWILRKSPAHVEFSETLMSRQILRPDTLPGTPSAPPLPTAVDGQVHVTYAGLAPEAVQTQVSAMGGSMTNAADVVRAILALKKSSTTAGPVMGGTFRPTPVVAHYGDLQLTKDGQALALVLQGTATQWFRRPWQVDVDVNEGPRYNHATHEMEINDPSGVTVIVLPMTTPDAPIVSMSDDYRVIQALATYEALRKAGRTVILVTYPQNDAAGRAALVTFIRQVAAPAGLEEGRGETGLTFEEVIQRLNAHTPAIVVVEEATPDGKTTRAFSGARGYPSGGDKFREAAQAYFQERLARLRFDLKFGSTGLGWVDLKTGFEADPAASQATIIAHPAPVPSVEPIPTTDVKKDLTDVVEAWREVTGLPATGQEPLNATLVFSETVTNQPVALAAAIAALVQGRSVAAVVPPSQQSRFAALAHALNLQVPYVVASNDAVLRQSLNDMNATALREIESSEDAVAWLKLPSPIPASVDAALTKTVEFLKADSSPYSRGAPVTVENVRAISRGAFLGLRQEGGSVGYFQVAKTPGERDNFGLARVDAAGQLLDREGPTTWFPPRQLVEPERAARLVTLTAGLEEAKTLALGSETDAAAVEALVKQLGPAPTNASEILWVPIETVTTARRALPALPRPGQFPVFMERPIFERLPTTIQTSPVITRHGFIPEQIPQAEAVVLALTDTSLNVASTHVPILRFATLEEVAGLTEESLVAAATSRVFKNHEIYWVPASAHPVTLNGRDGFAFYV